ncbi:MAG: hypothetical protein DSZ21_00805 [Tenericutes bacterium]|nr:MAG: hypothetical protein DSZ21_00805 [Mycoplasmatota bacterium]
MTLLATNGGHIFEFGNLANQIPNPTFRDNLDKIKNEGAIRLLGNNTVETLALTKFDLVTNAEHITALALAPVYLGSFIALSATTFK